MVPIFKGKGDIQNCSCHRSVKLRERGMKVVERVLEKMLNRIVSDDEMQFGFMRERKTIDVFILRRMQEEHHAKGKKSMCFEDLEKAFYIVPRKVFEWAMRKKGIPEVWVDQ